ncbi:hypothetical protein [Parasphingorhabdus sp.]|uniref:hypothetical protein n=1 Tax=Parasphingorhabdus sp. TaxID=2709688 RepID=UPI003A8DCC7E
MFRWHRHHNGVLYEAPKFYELNIMLSDLERIFPNICTHNKNDIDQIVIVRNNRGKLFGEQHFSTKFWDIILLIYSREINEFPIDAAEISRNLEISLRQVVRYLKVLLADNIICAYEGSSQNSFNIACDNLSLTKTGFANVGTIMDQTRDIFAAGQPSETHLSSPPEQKGNRHSPASD